MEAIQKFNSSLEVDELKQSLDTYALELAHERTLSETAAIYNKEDGRRHLVWNILLQDEKDLLHTQLVESERLVDELERGQIYKQNQLAIVQKSLDKAQQDLRLKSRDNDLLKAEVETLQSVSSESTKLLTKNLSLTRDLATLTTEIDHLRAQAASHQTLLSEKLALQRQLSTVQVELETEKRYSQRAQAKESRLQEEDAKMVSQIETIRAELAKERRQREKIEREMQKAQTDWQKRETALESRLEAKEAILHEVDSKLEKLDGIQAELTKERRQHEKAEVELQETIVDWEKRHAALESRLKAKETKLEDDDAKLEIRLESIQADLVKERRLREKSERDMQKATTDWENKRTTLESRLDAFRSKLRVSKDQLKATEKELENAKKSTRISDRPISVGLGEINGKNAMKRTSFQMDESMIGTPGDLPARKKNKSSVLPGDKSTFSITPFLNRSTILNPDDQPKDNGETENEDEISACHEPSSDHAGAMGPPAARLGRKAAPHSKNGNAGAAKTKVVKPKQAGAKGNNAAAAPQKRKAKAVSSLEKVTERDEETENENGERDTTRNESTTSAAAVIGPSFDDISSDGKHQDGKKSKKTTRRKLFGGDGGGGKTLFDDEDDDDDEGGNVNVIKAEVRAGGIKGMKVLGGAKSSFNAAKPSARQRIGLAPTASFGAISPLKRDKKTIAAPS
ncbi:hypothetical protein MMC31_003738 [Peltigera leucophlebia]|nr:hypothetical protein [Peltigera leucophlebia]